VELKEFWDMYMTEEYLEKRNRAMWLGYGSGPDAVPKMDEEHDKFHEIVSRMVDANRGSRVMPFVKAGYPPDRVASELGSDVVGFEEDLVFDVVRWFNTYERGATMRLLFWLGWTERTLRNFLVQELGKLTPLQNAKKEV
jgi:hypothetical protein